MINFQQPSESLDFSSEQSKKRIEQTTNLFGEELTKRLLCFCLYLMGANRIKAAAAVDLPKGSFFTLLNRIKKNGFLGFADRRRREAFPLVPKSDPISPQQPSATVCVHDDKIEVELSGSHRMTIPAADALRSRITIISLVCEGILSTTEASKVLHCSVPHISKLCKKLQEGCAEDFIDQRKGQQSDYKITPEIKHMLIAQTAAHVITGKSTSSLAITKAINEQVNIELTDRTVRQHMHNLGLNKLKNTLPSLIEALKKNFG